MDNEYSPPFAKLSDQNRGPLVIITIYIFLICSCLAAAVKIWTRLSTVKSLALTDAAMLMAVVWPMSYRAHEVEMTDMTS